MEFENDENDENRFEGFSEYLDHNNSNNNSNTVKRENQIKNGNNIIFENSDEDEEFHSKTELNHDIKKIKIGKKKEKNENKENKTFIKKKTVRKKEKDDQIIKKKKSGCVSKTNTEIDYEAIKKKNQKKFDDKYYNNYNNMNEDYLDMYGGNEEGNKPEGLDEMMNDLDDVDVNQRKPAYTCQNNSNLSQTLNMIITSDVNMNTNNNNDNNN
jgi:hypothetical protein